LNGGRKSSPPPLAVAPKVGVVVMSGKKKQQPPQEPAAARKALQLAQARYENSTTVDHRIVTKGQYTLHRRGRRTYRRNNYKYVQQYDVFIVTRSRWRFGLVIRARRRLDRDGRVFFAF